MTLDWQLVINILQFALWTVLGLYTWQSQRHQATREQVEHLRDELEHDKRRLRVLEERVDHMPSGSDFHELKGDVRVQGERLTALSEQLKSIDTYLRGKFG